MKTKDGNPKESLEQALAEVRAQGVDDATVQKAADRVWTRLCHEWDTTQERTTEVERIESCADFQALIPAYRGRTLAEARVTLFEDHIRECITCRKALWASRSLSWVTSQPAVAAASHGRAWKWGAAAAAAVVVFALFQFGVFQMLFGPQVEIRAIAQTVDGTLLRVSAQNIQPMRAGETLGPGQTIRTARGSGAIVQLADGSRLEMAERSQMSLESGRDGPTIRLDRGSVIVQAARQHGHLYVATVDCLVSVKGTVFSVNRGAKGSRISVIEGEVWVEHGKKQTVLKPGQQVATDPSLGTVPIDQEVAWSRNVDQHIAMLRELAAVNQVLHEKLWAPELRSSSSLLGLAPQGTIVYAAFPNVSQTLAEAYTLFSQRVQENPVLSEWWSKQQSGCEGATVEELIGRVQKLGGYLGAEVVLAVPQQPGQPLLLADVRQPIELRAALEEDVARVTQLSQGEAKILIVDDPAQIPAATDRSLIIYVGHTIMAISPSADEIRRVAASAAAGGAGSFVGTSFHTRLASAYAEGVGWLFAVDLQTVLAKEQSSQTARAAKEAQFIGQLGFSDIQQLIVEQKNVNGQAQTRAILSFSGARRGVANWLAEPAAMGALDFVSPDAYGVAAFVVREPAALVDELFAALQASDQEGWQELVEFQAQHGINIREDIAAPLGGEFVFTVDGPVLPTPSWKIVAEVYDPVRLQNTLERMIAEINLEAAQEGKPELTLTAEQSGGLTFYALSAPAVGQEAHYVFVDGYLIMAPSRALLTQAIQYRQTGYTLPRAGAFRALLPIDRQNNCSGLLYHNLTPLVGALAQYIPESGAGLTPEQAQKLKEAAAATPPMLICVYAEEDQIVLAGGQLGLNLATLAGFGNLVDMLKMNPETLVGSSALPKAGKRTAPLATRPRQ